MSLRTKIFGQEERWSVLLNALEGTGNLSANYCILKPDLIEFKGNLILNSVA